MATLEVSAALLFTDPLRLDAMLDALAETAVDELHLDIIDGKMMDSFGFSLRAVEAIAGAGGRPVHVHLLVEQPDRWIGPMAAAGCKALTVHVEAGGHLHRTLGQIRASGMAAGIALKPATSLTKLTYLLPEADRVLVLADDPVQPLRAPVRAALERVRILRQNLDYYKYKIVLDVEGLDSPADAARAATLGAQRITLGRGPVLEGPPEKLAARYEEWAAEVARQRQVV